MCKYNCILNAGERLGVLGAGEDFIVVSLFCSYLLNSFNIPGRVGIGDSKYRNYTAKSVNTGDV